MYVDGSGIRGFEWPLCVCVRVCVISKPWPKRGSFVGPHCSSQLQELYSLQVCVYIILHLHIASVLVSCSMRVFVLAQISFRDIFGSQREIKSQEMAEIIELGDYKLI